MKPSLTKRPFTKRLCLVAIGVGLVSLGVRASDRSQGQAQPLAPDAEFTVAVSMTTIEAGPIYAADEGPYGGGFRVINGGVRNLANGTAHAATNAETQMLLVLPAAPNVRMLFTVAEGLYRVIARRSAGITTLKDLRGKRIITPRNTSAHYHLVKMLSKAGLQEVDVTLVDVEMPQMATAIAKREADAISMWEPVAQDALNALGGDAIVFQDNAVYRELFSLYTTTEVLRDQKRRRELVEFVRALLIAADTARTAPRDLMPIIARIIRQPEEKVSNSWRHHAFPAALPSDMLDVLTEEERWIAKMQQREPRTRVQLATFIDTSVLKEAENVIRRP